MKHQTLVLLVLGIVLTAFGRTHAQQDAPSSPEAQSPGFDVHGSFDFGYRFTKINGSMQTFRQLFDLSQGPRLMGLELRGDAKGSGHEFADDFTLSTSGLGGDPFPSMQFTLHKSRLYDLRMNWRKSRFFDIAPATPSSIAGLDTQAVTDRHGWNTSRQIGNVALTLDATNRLHFLFSYDRVSREGVLQTTRALDFVGSPATWGAFARANPYPIVAPVLDLANRIGGGVSYAGNRWSLHYSAGYQTNDETQTLDAASLPERSINVAEAATANELLETFGWSQSRRLTAPFSELTYVTQPSSRIEWRGEYLYSRYRGPFNLDGAFQGTARTTGTALSPYDVAITARADLTAPSHVVGQGFTYRPFDRWAFDIYYRYTRFSSEATGQLGSLLVLYPPAASVPAQASENDDIAWRLATHTVDLSATFEPNRTLTIRPGLLVARRDVEHRQNGVVEGPTSDRERTYWPELTVAYRPVSQFSARGSWVSSYSDTSFTRLSPTERRNGRVVVRVEPLAGLVVEASASRNDAELPSAGFSSHVRLGSIQASYAFSELFTVLGGLDYQSFLGLGNVTFLRGVAPIAGDEMSDREVDRVWQAGVVVKPTSRLGITATANFDRTTGVDAIAGEPPLYGPVTFPYATGTIYYEIPRAGRLSIDLQRTYMFQDLLPLNDFRANLFTIHYSRNF